MPEPVNPLIPSGYDIAWTSVAVIALALVVIALVSLARAAAGLTRMQSLIWTLVAIFVPVIGPIAWLFIGRAAVRETSPHTHDRPLRQAQRPTVIE